MHNPDKRNQWVPPDHDPKPVVRQSRSGHKVMLSVWWNFEGIVHFQLIPDGCSVNGAIYSEKLDRLYQIIAAQYPSLVNRKSVLFHHDNAPAHRSQLTQDKIQELNGFEVLPHHPYNSNIAPSDYGLFRSMASFLRGQRFETYDDVERACRVFFASKPKDWYRDQIRKLAERWVMVIENNGLYFEE